MALPLPARVLACALAVSVLGAVKPADVHAQLTPPGDLPDDFFADADFRHVGPVGNRVSAVTGEPGNASVYYLGAASGGVFKSEDGGHTWRPIFDDQPAQSIGALAIAPSDPNVVWAGTGESFIRSNVSIGNGVYRSTDAGRTWRHMGLDETGRIGRIVVHPINPDIAYVAAAGHLYGPQQERGLFRTTDGGESWERVLFSGENSGAIDVVMDPTNPRILFAATWQMQIWTWGRESGGPESGLWTSRDGGDSWTRLERAGLPRGTMGRIGLAMTPADPDRIYALIETNSNRDYEELEDHEGTLWRSDDGGSSWAMVNADHALAQRPLYYSRMAVAPDDPDEVHFMSTVHTRSLDGGVSFEVISGGDNHDMWIDPLDPDRMIIGNDQGVRISTNRGRNWYRPLLPIAQMYHVHADTRVPYNLYGNRQDGPSTGGPSNTLSQGPIPVGAWRSVGGCETGFAIPDTVTNDVVWSGCYEGILERHQLSTGITRTISVWPDNPEGWAAADVRYRFQWTFPVHISPHDNEVVYAGSQHVHRTVDGGHSWSVISPDLTRADTTRMQKTGGLTTEDVSPTYASVLFAIAESPIEAGAIWAGSNDGLVHITRDGGGSWTEVARNIAGLPEWGTVSNIEPSRHNPAAAYITADFHPAAGENPDYGASINFHLGEELAGPVTVDVLTMEGEPVRTMSGSFGPGMNRMMWDLRHRASASPRLRTPALEHSHRGVGQDGWRPPPDGGPVRPLAIPGRYRVRLTAGAEQRTAELEILRDPASTASAEEMRAQLALQLELREMSDSTAELISRIEWTRRGLADLEERVRGNPVYAEIAEVGEELAQALIDLEMELFDLRLTGGSARQDTIRWPRRLWAKIASLAGYSAGSDDPPTESMREIGDIYQLQLEEYLGRWAEMAADDIADFNRLLAERGLPPIIS